MCKPLSVIYLLGIPQGFEEREGDRERVKQREKRAREGGRRKEEGRQRRGKGRRKKREGVGERGKKTEFCVDTNLQQVGRSCDYFSESLYEMV